MSFAHFNFTPEIAKAITLSGYTEPTPIQAGAIPFILQGRDVVASAQTGSGKTAAFILPALNLLAQERVGSKPRILILTPTRELATQIAEAAGKYGKYMKFNSVSLVGGMPYKQQLRGLSRPVDLIVATPGRLMDHMENKRLDLSQIKMLILDEADRMLDMGFIDDVNHIAKATPKSRQTLLFSATVDGKLTHIIKQLLNEPERVNLSDEKLAPVQIRQLLYSADNMQHKSRLLKHFLDQASIYKAIIFSATKINADNLAEQLREDGYEASALHGDLKQNVRNRTLEQFRRGQKQFLVATDIAARGIDVPDITHVINFDLPKFSEDYAHRIGRTGRAGKEGTAISFALPMDGRNVQKIERFMGQRFEASIVPGLEPTKGFSSSREKSKPSRSKSKGSSFAKSSFSKGRPSRSSRSTDDSRQSFSRNDRSESTGTRRRDKDTERFKKITDTGNERRRTSERPFSRERETEKSSRFERSSERPFSRGRETEKSPRFERSSERPFSRERETEKAPRFERSSERSFSRDTDRKGQRSSTKPERSSERSFSKEPQRKIFKREGERSPKTQSFQRDERPSNKPTVRIREKAKTGRASERGSYSESKSRFGGERKNPKSAQRKSDSSFKEGFIRKGAKREDSRSKSY